MAYHDLGSRSLEYYPCRYGTSKLLFRGPRRDLGLPYVAMLGSTETYGKFVEEPYPALLEKTLDKSCVNLGHVNAGVDLFLHEEMIIDIASKASATVLEVPGAHTLTNRFYAVHRRRNDRFLRASNMLRTIYREVDFTEIHFTRHLLGRLRATSADKFDIVVAELQEAWVARMKALLTRIPGDVLLLWVSDHRPEEADLTGIDGSDPMFVDRAMLDKVLPFATDLVEVVVSPEEIAEGQRGLVHDELEAPAAAAMLGTKAHEKAARELARVLPDLM